MARLAMRKVFKVHQRGGGADTWIDPGSALHTPGHVYPFDCHSSTMFSQSRGVFAWSQGSVSFMSWNLA